MTARRSIEERLADAGLGPLPRTAWIELDLDRLLGNLGALRAALPPGVRLEPVLKADAYGHGAVPIGRALEAAGADGFSVATFDEAVELRQGGLRAPILCLYAVPASVVREAMRLDVAVAASSEELARTHGDRRARPPGAARAAPDPGARCASTSTSRRGSGGPGSARSGSAPRSVGSAPPGVRLAGVWSHLQQADDRERTDRQAARFAAALGGLAEAWGRVPARHLANSAGLLGRAVPAYDAVRIGLATYGIVPDDVPAAARTRTPPRASGRSCRSMPGRSASPTCRRARGSATARRSARRRPSRIATLPAGLRRRLPRAVSNRAEALVRGGASRSSGTWRWTR